MALFFSRPIFETRLEFATLSVKQGGIVEFELSSTANERADKQNVRQKCGQGSLCTSCCCCQDRERFGEITHFSQNTYTHLSGQSFLRHHFESVDHRDVSEPPGDGQSAVPILERKKIKK